MKLGIMIFGSVVLLGIIALAVWFKALPFSVDYADKVYVKFHFGETKIDCEITDKNDIRKLKSMFRTVSITDGDGTPSCGFDSNVSITFQRNNKKVTICPGVDTCGSFLIGESNRYISFLSRKKLKEFHKIFRKYHNNSSYYGWDKIWAD